MGNIIFYLLLLSIALASLNSVVLHKVNLSVSNAVYKFNMIGAAVCCVSLFAVNGLKIHIDKTVLFWGIIYGVTQTLFILFKTLAMNSGAVSITTLVGNMSLVISVVFCYIVWQEPVGVTDIIGLVILVFGIIMSTYEKNNESISRKWVLYAVLFLIFAASVGITFKAFGKTGSKHAGDMMIVAAFVMLISYAAICFISKNRNFTEEIIKPQKKFIIYALLSGILACAYNRLNIYLSSNMNAAIFFPSFNGGTIMFSTVLSVLMLKEKLKLKTTVGIILGIACICIIGIL